MADLMSADGSERSRGQMLLVAVLVLAAAFIVLALVVNSAIFTENLATQDDVAGAEEAIEERAAVEDNLEEILRDANHDEEAHFESQIEDRFSSGVNSYEHLERLPQSYRTQIVDVQYTDSYTPGIRIAQNDHERNFTNIEGETSYVLTEGVSKTRDVVFNFTHIDTGSTVGLLTDDPFEMELDDGDNTVIFEASSDSTDFLGVSFDDDQVAYRIGVDGEHAVCVSEEPSGDNPSEVDLTAGTINGEPCEAFQRLQDTGANFEFGANLEDEYQIEFSDAANVEGSYSMIHLDGSTRDDTFESHPDDGDPYEVDAIYDAYISYTYHTHNVAYETDFRVAPGEVQTDD